MPERDNKIRKAKTFKSHLSDNFNVMCCACFYTYIAHKIQNTFNVLKECDVALNRSRTITSIWLYVEKYHRLWLKMVNYCVYISLDHVPFLVAVAVVVSVYVLTKFELNVRRSAVCSRCVCALRAVYFNVEFLGYFFPNNLQFECLVFLPKNYSLQSKLWNYRAQISAKRIGLEFGTKKRKTIEVNLGKMGKISTEKPESMQIQVLFVKKGLHKTRN